MKKILIALIFLNIFINTSCSSILSPKEFKYSDLVGNWKATFKSDGEKINFAIHENGRIMSENTAFNGKIDGMEGNSDSTVSSAKGTFYYGGQISVEFTSSSYGEGKYNSDGEVDLILEKQQ